MFLIHFDEMIIFFKTKFRRPSRLKVRHTNVRSGQVHSHDPFICNYYSGSSNINQIVYFAKKDNKNLIMTLFSLRRVEKIFIEKKFCVRTLVKKYCVRTVVHLRSSFKLQMHYSVNWLFKFTNKRTSQHWKQEKDDFEKTLEIILYN
jgi:hypothetical protein